MANNNHQKKIYLFLWTLFVCYEIYSPLDPNLDKDHESSTSNLLIINDNDPTTDDPTTTSATPTQTNNKSIDWSQVEHRFNEYLSDEEILQKWELMEANMKSGIKSLLRTVFPKVVAMASDAKVSNNCSAGILKWIVNIRHMKSWALKMLDAMGKPPSGIFEGVVTMFGNYDECLKIRVFHEDDDEEDDSFIDSDVDRREHGAGSIYEQNAQDGQVEFFRGQYCIMEFKPWLPKKPHFYGINSQYKFMQDDDTVFSEFVKMSLFFHFITFRVDICVPSTCSKEDMQKVATLMANLAEFRARVLRCEVQIDDTNLWSDWWIFFIISFIILSTMLLTLTSTLIDLNITKNRLSNSKIFRMYSMVNFWKQISTVKHSNDLNSLYVFRVIILIWIIIVHTFIIVDFQYFREMQTLKSWATKWPSQVITNSLFQFDCLILISAFTFGYNNIHSNRKQLLEFIFKRYFKLITLIMFVIFLTYLIPHLIFPGPLTKDFLPKLSENIQCRNNVWWQSILFIQNYLHPDCLPHTWIFCVELQLMLLMLPLMLIQNRYQISKWVFWLTLPLLLTIGFMYNFFMVYSKRLPPTYYWTLPDKEQRHEYFSEYYHKPWAHLSIFVIGFYAGVYRKLSNKCKNHFIVSRNFTYIGYTLSIVTILSFMFGFHGWIINELPNQLISALYNALSNIALSMAYSWIMFSSTCHSSLVIMIDSSSSSSTSSSSRSSTFFNRLFNNRLLIIMGKLTISAYLILPLLQTYLLSSQQQHLYSSNILMLYVIIGNIILTYSFALGVSFLFEKPIRLILSSLVNYLLNCNIMNNQISQHNQNTQKPPPTINNDATTIKSHTNHSFNHHSNNINSIELSLNK